MSVMHFLLVTAIACPVSTVVSVGLLEVIDRIAGRCRHYGAISVESVVPSVGVVARLCPKCSKQLSV